MFKLEMKYDIKHRAGWTILLHQISAHAYVIAMENVIGWKVGS